MKLFISFLFVSWTVYGKGNLIPTIKCETEFNLTTSGNTLSGENINDQFDFGTCSIQTCAILNAHEINITRPRGQWVNNLLAEEMAVGYHKRRGKTSQYSIFELLNNGTNFCDVVNTMRGKSVHYGYDPRQGGVARSLVHLERLFNQMVPYSKELNAEGKKTKYPQNKQVEFCLNNTVSKLIEISKNFSVPDVINQMGKNPAFAKVWGPGDDFKLFKAHFLSYLQKKQGLNYFSLLLGDNTFGFNYPGLLERGQQPDSFRKLNYDDYNFPQELIKREVMNKSDEILRGRSVEEFLREYLAEKKVYEGVDPLKSFIIEFNSALYEDLPKKILKSTPMKENGTITSINHFEEFKECLDNVSGKRCAASPTEDQFAEFVEALAYVLDNLEGVDSNKPFVENIIEHIASVQNLEEVILPGENQVECVEKQLIKDEQRAKFDSEKIITTLKKPIGIFVHATFFHSNGYKDSFTNEEIERIKKVRLYFDYIKKNGEVSTPNQEAPVEPTYEDYVLAEKYYKEGSHAMAAVGDGQNCWKLGANLKKVGRELSHCLLIQNSWGYDLQLNSKRYPDYMIPYTKIEKDGLVYSDYSRFWVCDASKVDAHFSGYGFMKSKMTDKGSGYPQKTIEEILEERITIENK